ncbi:MAG: hypothetical protein LBR87_08765 [Synergistaceae bacterium]|jgi:uncharacterized membrane protein YebE (DUF533 family)|nr:hypothetical protein [Synergistaceae bacterium]
MCAWVAALAAVAGTVYSAYQSKKASEAAYVPPPKVIQEPPSVKTEAIEDTQNMAAYNMQLRRRKAAAFSRSDTQAGGAMQTAGPAVQKDKLGV